MQSVYLDIVVEVDTVGCSHAMEIHDICVEVPPEANAQLNFTQRQSWIQFKTVLLSINLE